MICRFNFIDYVLFCLFILDCADTWSDSWRQFLSYSCFIYKTQWIYYPYMLKVLNIRIHFFFFISSCYELKFMTNLKLNLICSLVFLVWRYWRWSFWKHVCYFLRLMLMILKKLLLKVISLLLCVGLKGYTFLFSFLMLFLCWSFQGFEFWTLWGVSLSVYMFVLFVYLFFFLRCCFGCLIQEVDGLLTFLGWLVVIQFLIQLHSRQMQIGFLEFY